jgi:hypothetical protein
LRAMADGGGRGAGWIGIWEAGGEGGVLALIDTIIVHANTLQKVMIL